MTVIRPSKQFLFDILRTHLAAVNRGVGIDAAAANFKNRPMFRTENYVGIDIDEQMLKAGLNRWKGDGAVSGVRADLRNLSALPQSYASVVVSTNTLHQLASADRIRAVKELTGLVAPEGMIFLELPVDIALPAIVRFLNNKFAGTKVIYYKNPISRVYEKLFERRGDLGSHPIAGSRPFRLLSFIISRLEYLTCNFRLGNRYAILVCKNLR